MPRKRATHYALVDSAFAADRKFVRLAARAQIPMEFAAAVGVYFLILADCRRSKSPEVDWSDYEEYAPQIELLQAVGLLTESGASEADHFLRDRSRPSITNRMRAAVAFSQGAIRGEVTETHCAYCATRITIDWRSRRVRFVGPGGIAAELDHVEPWSEGGAHEPGNLVPACRPCNRAKAARPVP